MNGRMGSMGTSPVLSPRAACVPGGHGVGPRPLYPTPLGEEENRREGGEANFRLECRLIQSAGKNDNGSGFGSLGNWRGEAEVGPFTQSGKVMAPAECRRGAGRGAQLLNGRLAGPARASVPSWEPAQPRAVSVSSKQEKS